MAEKHLDTPGVNFTPYYQEETAERGGAAVMRMVLGSDKLGLNPLPSQQDLYNDAHGRNDATEPAGVWYIDPQGLRDSLMHFKPASFTNIFVNYDFAAADRAQANAKIVYTIDHYEVAPAVLVGAGPQWLAVVGYRTDAGGALQAVFVNDPRPPITDGTGDPPDFEVAAATWNDPAGGYFRPVNGGVRWNNRFAMVCDPDPPRGELPAARDAPHADGRRILDPEQIVELSRRALKERGTLKRELFARAVEGGTPAKPQLVQMLDREDRFYYLVRYQIEGQDAAVIALDARFGVFLEGIAYRRPLRFFRITAGAIPRLLSKGLVLEERLEDVRDRIIGLLAAEPCRPDRELLHRRLEVELARLRQPIGHREPHAEEIDVHPLMVWQASAASLSMLYPFYQVNTPRRRIYIRAADAGIFTVLDPLFWLRLGG